MADYIASRIFSGLTPRTFNKMMNHFNIALSVPEDVERVPASEMGRQWNALLRGGEPSTGVFSDIGQRYLRGISGLHDYLQRLHALVEGKCDVMQLARELSESLQYPVDFPEDFDRWSPYERGTFIFNEDENFWNNLCNLASARNVESSRMWIDYHEGLPNEVPGTDEQTIRRLQDVLVDFFRESKRSEFCRIDSYIRKYQYYYFATLCDVPKYDEVLVNGQSGDVLSGTKEDTGDLPGEFDLIPLVHPFRIIFVYDERGQFSIYGKLGKMEFDPLARQLVNILVGYSGPFQRLPRTAYNLNLLRKPDFDFKLQAMDQIESINVVSLTFSPCDDEMTKFTLTNRSHDIYQCLRRYVGRTTGTEGVDLDTIDILRVVLSFRMKDTYIGFRSFSVELGRNSSNVKSLEDHQRELGEKYIQPLVRKEITDISLHSLLTAARSDSSVFSLDSLGGIAPEQVKAMLNFGLLEETEEATEIHDDMNAYPVFMMTDLSGKTVYCNMDLLSYKHETDPWEIKRFRFNFESIVRCIHDKFDCREEIVSVSDDVWYLGTAGSEHRRLYVVRNLSANKQAQEKLLTYSSGSLVFYTGPEPTEMRLGTLTSEKKEDRIRLQKQFYCIDYFLEYIPEEGYVFDVDEIRERLSDLKETSGPGRGRRKLGPSAGEAYRQKAESAIWCSFNRQLKAAQNYVKDEPDADVNTAYLTYTQYTQKELCKKINVPEKTISELKKKWKEDFTGYGELFLDITDRFIMRRPQKNKSLMSDSDKAEQLNQFYGEHREVIDGLRQRRPVAC